MFKEMLMSCIVVGFVQSFGIRVVSTAANLFIFFPSILVSHIGQQIVENFATWRLPIRVYRNTDELDSCSCSCGVLFIATNNLILVSKLC